MQDQNVTFVVNHKVKSSAFEQYEAWLRRISARASEAKGHQGVHIIRPVTGGDEYAIILRWATFEDAKNWAESPERKQLIEEAANLFAAPDRVEIKTGIDFWFTPPDRPAHSAPRWKQWLVTTSVIWPLTMIVPALLQPVFKSIPFLEQRPLGPLIIASIIVGLVTFVIMPFYAKVISGWLFRK